MNNHDRVIAQGDPISEFWLTRQGCRLVAFVAAHAPAVERLSDVMTALEADHRVQVVVTTPATGHHWEEIHELVRGLGWLVVPWRQAVRTRYDLAIAACDWGLSELDAPAVLLSHGAGTQRSRVGPAGGSVPHAFHPDRLIRGGEVVPAALALASDREVAALARSCPAALPRAVVVGDPSFDRMCASLPYRDQYRAALGVHPGQKAVLASTTWSPASLFGQDPGVFTRLMTELPPDEYRVVAALHPFVWRGHGRRQVLGWLAEAIGMGLQVLDPATTGAGVCAPPMS